LTSTVTKDEQVLEEQQNDVLDYLDNEASAVVHSNKPTQLSRLHSEFEELDWLGKGGYGDVVKVGCFCGQREDLSYSSSSTF